MDRYPPPGWAARWSGNQRDREKNYDFRYLPEDWPHRNCDIWIERYVPYLRREHERLGGGAIGRHYLACIEARCREFQASGSQEARFQAWVGVRLLCQWLSQLERWAS